MLEDPRAPLRPLGCLSLRVVYHGHPSPLKGGLRGCWKVGLSEAEHGVPSCPQRASGQHTSPAHPDPTAAAHPRGPPHCHQGIRGCRELRPEGAGGLHGIVCAPLPGSRSSCGERVYTAGTHRRLQSTARPGGPGAPGGGLGRTSDHFPLCALGFLSTKDNPTAGGPLRPRLLCGRGRVRLECAQGT